MVVQRFHRTSRGSSGQSRRFFPLLLLLCALVPAAVESVDGSGEPVNLEFSIDDVEFGETLRFGRIRARCHVVEIRATAVSCTRATLTAAESPVGPVALSAQLTWAPRGNRFMVSAGGRLGDSTVLELVFNIGSGGRRMEISVSGFDLPGLPAMLPAVPVLATHSIESGALAFSATCNDTPGGTFHCETSGELTGLNLNGNNVAEDLDASYSATIDAASDGIDLAIEMTMRTGAAYVEPGFEMGGIKPGFFIDASRGPIGVSAMLSGLGSTDVRIESAQLSHPQVAEMRFAGELRFEPEPRWSRLDLKLQADNVAALYETYLQPLTLNTSFDELETTGGLTVSLVGAANEIDELVLRLDKIYIDDNGGRFSLYGLDGEIHLHAGDELRESHVGWIGGAVYKVPIGAGRIDWTSAQRNLTVASWQDVELFDGVLRLDTLEVRNFSLSDTELALSGTLTPITLSALTAAFGWMPLSGKLSGEIPLLTYAGNHLTMEGDLRVNVFDGRITIGDLSIDKLFSTVPELQANIAVDQLELEELTRTLSFGNITGRIDGRIEDLVLQAWQPIRFDASFATPIDDPTPHRISRQAVDNLGRLGAGTGSALSQGWLSLIPSYSYGRLGIGCQLLNGHCQMRGVEPDASGGFFILTRGGILPPWIDVKGTGRRIRWQTLVDGIKQIARGNIELNIGAPGAVSTE